MNPQLSDKADQIVARLERAAAMYRDEMQARHVPAHLIEGLVRYLVHRIRPGHFLVAVIASDMRDALGRAADGDTQRGILTILLFLFSVAPAESWGSYEALESWLDKGEAR